MSFCTVINCLDGRVQMPVNRYLQDRFGVLYIDTITAAGPARLFSSGQKQAERHEIVRRIQISQKAHGSEKLALVAHYDCAGNPLEEKEQRLQLQYGVKSLRRLAPAMEIIALWVDENWSVHELTLNE